MNFPTCLLLFLIFVKGYITPINAEVRRLCGFYRFGEFNSAINSAFIVSPKIFRLNFLNEYPTYELNKFGESPKILEIFKSHIANYNTLSESNKTRLKLRINDEKNRLRSTNPVIKNRIEQFFEKSKKVIELIDDNKIPEVYTDRENGEFIQEFLDNVKTGLIFTNDYEKIFNLKIATFDRTIDDSFGKRIVYNVSIPFTDERYIPNQETCNEKGLPAIIKKQVIILRNVKEPLTRIFTIENPKNGKHPTLKVFYGDEKSFELVNEGFTYSLFMRNGKTSLKNQKLIIQIDFEGLIRYIFYIFEEK